MSLLHTAYIPAGDGPFPTVIALHGLGASALDLLDLAPVVHGGRAVFLCPQGPVPVPFGNGQYGYSWFPLRIGEPVDVAAFEQSANSLRDFVSLALQRYPIDPKKVALAGFSQGGMMGYELALREPSRFAGLAALSTWFPPELAATLPKVPEQEGFPVLIIHGTRDDRIEVERARESREALRPYGVNLTYREHEMGHEVRLDALRLVEQWLTGRAWKER